MWFYWKFTTSHENEREMPSQGFCRWFTRDPEWFERVVKTTQPTQKQARFRLSPPMKKAIFQVIQNKVSFRNLESFQLFVFLTPIRLPKFGTVWRKETLHAFLSTPIQRNSFFSWKRNRTLGPVGNLPSLFFLKMSPSAWLSRNEFSLEWVSRRTPSGDGGKEAYGIDRRSWHGYTSDNHLGWCFELSPNFS